MMAVFAIGPPREDIGGVECSSFAPTEEVTFQLGKTRALVRGVVPPGVRGYLKSPVDMPAGASGYVTRPSSARLASCGWDGRTRTV